MDYSYLQLKVLISPIEDKFKQWKEKFKGKVVIVEKAMHVVQGGNSCLEIWYHASKIEDHEKVMIFQQNESAHPFIMEIPSKVKRFKFGNMPGWSAYHGGNDEYGYRHFWLTTDDHLTNPTHSLQISLEDAKRHFTQETYSCHQDYQPEDNPV